MANKKKKQFLNRSHEGKKIEMRRKQRRARKNKKVIVSIQQKQSNHNIRQLMRMFRSKKKPIFMNPNPNHAFKHIK